MTAWVPTPSCTPDGVVHVVVGRVTAHSTVVPEVKVTVPVGVPANWGATVAVSTADDRSP